MAQGLYSAAGSCGANTFQVNGSVRIEAYNSHAEVLEDKLEGKNQLGWKMTGYLDQRVSQI